jgi:hypothetical protein
MSRAIEFAGQPWFSPSRRATMLWTPSAAMTVDAVSVRPSRARERDTIARLAGLCDVESRDQFGTGIDSQRREQRIELEPADHQSGGTVSLDDRRLSIGAFEVQARNFVDANPAERRA